MARDVVRSACEYTQELPGGTIEIHSCLVFLLERSNHDRHNAVDSLPKSQSCSNGVQFGCPNLLYHSEAVGIVSVKDV